MKHLFNIRLFAVLWVGLIAVLNSTPIKAQFDEPSRNQWIIDLSYGFAGSASDPEISMEQSYNELRSANNEGLSSFSISFGVNHRLFKNMYAGVRLGYKYYGNKTDVSYWHSHTYEYETATAGYHTVMLPIEFGYNHTYNHKNGLNLYISAIPQFPFSAGMGAPLSWKCDLKKPAFGLEAAAGLRYFIRHVYIGFSYHKGINYYQKQMGESFVEGSIGYRF